MYKYDKEVKETKMRDEETLEKLMKKKIYIPSPEVDFKKERKRAAKK